MARNVHFHDFDAHDVTGFHHVARVFDEFFRQRADVYQAILMNANIHECAKVGDVGHDTF